MLENKKCLESMIEGAFGIIFHAQRGHWLRYSSKKEEKGTSILTIQIHLNNSDLIFLNL